MCKKVIDADVFECFCDRLIGCRCLIDSLSETAEVTSVNYTALQCVSDLLENIRLDFQGYVGGAEDYAGEGAKV